MRLFVRRTRRGPARTLLTYGGSWTPGRRPRVHAAASERIGRVTASTSGSLTVRLLRGVWAKIR